MLSEIYPEQLNASYFRLLVLEPAGFEKPLTCSLTRYSTRNRYLTSYAYEAASYTWGDETQRRDILCNGHPLSITHDLEIALRHLRSPASERVLWIDQICINQSIDERSAWVTLIGSIYRCALRVVVWLGPESETSDLAITFLHDIGSANQNKPTQLPKTQLANRTLVEYCRVTFPWSDIENFPYQAMDSSFLMHLMREEQHNENPYVHEGTTAYLLAN